MKKQKAATIQPNSPSSKDVEAQKPRSIVPENSADRSADQNGASSSGESSGSNSAEDIRLQAYYKWEMAGRPDGNDLFFWVEAEREANRANKT